MTAGDVLARLGANSTGRGVGLRGGTFKVVTDPTTIHVTLTGVRWTEDLAVSGTIDKPISRHGTVHATLHLAGPEGLTGELAVNWPEGVAGSDAAMRGTLGGAIVVARMPAP
jgi:hypothetical protein